MEIGSAIAVVVVTDTQCSGEAEPVCILILY